MKMMTCKQIGGPCDAQIYGDTAEEIMTNGEKHIREVDDEGHKASVQMMAETAANPESAKKWQDEFMTTYNQLTDI